MTSNLVTYADANHAPKAIQTDQTRRARHTRQSPIAEVQRA